MEQLITISEAAKQLGVSIYALREWDKDGKLVVARTAGKHRRYRQSDITRLQGLGWI